MLAHTSRALWRRLGLLVVSTLAASQLGFIPTSFFVDTADAQVGSPTAWSIADSSQAEGDGPGSTIDTFTVSRSTASGVDCNITATISFGSGNTANAADFVTLSPQNFIMSGSATSRSINAANVVGDTTVEPDETYTVTIVGAVFGSFPACGIADGVAVGTILNDDSSASPWSIADSSQAEGDGPGSTVDQFTVSRSTASGVDCNITATISFGSGNTATAADFVTLSPQNFIMSGSSTSRSINAANVVGDTTVEPDETYTVTIVGTPFGQTPACDVGDGVAVGTIVNDDGPPTCLGETVTVDLAAGQLPTAGPDVIAGTPGPDAINGGGGNDVICGAGGHDTISGSVGNDRIDGGDGNDTIFGGDGDDVIYGSNGNDTVQGNAGGDLIEGGAGTDALSGNEDGDFITGGDDADTIYGVAGTDTLSGESGDDTILGGLGDDFLFGGDGVDLLSGNAGGDELDGGADDDTLYGVDGNDQIDGGLGIDTVLGGLGADTINGGDGNDALSGNQDGDTINGGAGNDAIYGVDGNDTLSGDAGSDTILGGNQNDTITGGDDNDLLSGNAGIDTMNGGPGADEVYGADGNDSLTGGNGSDIILGGNNDDTIDSQDNTADNVSGNAGNDTCLRDPGLDSVFACETQIP